MPLQEYRRKRNFEKTIEPRGQTVRTTQHRFVIQKHAASRLHYDFRLEIDGTLRSWAVPKGIPYKKGDKRLAVQVEDHPVSYIDFEGVIPEGEYGAGTVMVWDRGTFETSSPTPEKDLEGGKLHFSLDGKKLHGQWYLVRLRNGNQWLLIRGQDDMRPISKTMDDTSALSGKSMEELGEGNQVWNSNRDEIKKPSIPLLRKKLSKPVEIKFIEPMKARLVASPPEGEWIYEIKLDGFRALAFKQGSEVRLLSRNEKDFAEKFPEVAGALAGISAEEAVIDGEIVALDPKGRSSFQLLQAYDLGEERPPIYYYVFDLLSLNGKDLRNQPLFDRKELLEKVVKNVSEVIRFSASLEGPPEKLLEQARRLGLEGLMAKRKDSVYEPGRRSGAWIKLKLHREQEFVIGGYTPPQGSRQHFGSLLVGYYDKKGLYFAGKVGTGFDKKLLKALHAQLESISIPECPFYNLPEKKGSRYSPGLTVAEMRRCHWVKPALVCQVKYSEWTRDGKLRQPVFLGLRQDKPASEVVRETPE